MCLVIGRTYGIPTVALRFFNVFGIHQALVEPLHRRSRDLRLPLLERQSASDLRGRLAAARFRQRLRYRPRRPPRSRNARSRRAGAQHRQRPPAHRAPGRGNGRRRARQAASRRRSPGSTARATSATASPTSRKPATCWATSRRSLWKKDWSSWPAGLKARRRPTASPKRKPSLPREDSPYDRRDNQLPTRVKPALITGGCGFVGANVAAHLLRSGRRSSSSMTCLAPESSATCNGFSRNFGERRLRPRRYPRRRLVAAQVRRAGRSTTSPPRSPSPPACRSRRRL